MLAISLAIIIGVQIFVASPFLFDEVAYAMGFKMGAGTSVMQYIERSKLFGGKIGGANHGAGYNVSIYF